jgi:hypothetical protein
VAADPTSRKEKTLAVPGASVKSDFVSIVVAMEGSIETVDTYPLLFYSVFPGFVHLSDNARIHRHLQLGFPDWNYCTDSLGTRSRQVIIKVQRNIFDQGYEDDGNMTECPEIN